MGNGRNKRFVSIGKKIVWAITFFMFLFIILFSLYIYYSMQKNAMERYEQNVMIDTEIAGNNIDYYVESMIRATKSVYINHPLMEFLKNHHSKKELADNESRIMDYFNSVYYTSTVASQIYLAMPEENLSLLYEPRYLKISDAPICGSVEIPEMENHMDVYIEPTHVKTSYGHNLPAMEQYPADELVFTIWLPISNLPADSKPIAYLAIDFPISFITSNCGSVYSQKELLYVIDEEQTVIAANDPAAVMKSFQNFYPGYKHSDEKEILVKYKEQLIAETKIDSRYFNWSVVKVTHLKDVYALTAEQLASILFLFGILAILVLAIISLQILKYVRSLRQITSYMERGREDLCWGYDRQISDYIIYREKDEISSLIESFQRLMDSLKEHEIQKYELQLAYTKYELKTMQAQINPHFIYNVIQCFATNALKDHNLKQYQMISSFGQMLHYAMVLEPFMVATEKEIEYVERYVSLQQMRFDRKLNMVYEIAPESSDFKIPKMSVQPLVENALNHGNLMKKDGSVIRIKTEFENEQYRLLVEDNGVAVADEAVKRIYNTINQLKKKLMNRDSTEGSSQELALEYSFKEDENHNHFIGIENVFSRLLLSFGSCDFKIYANNIGGTSVEFCVPMKEKVSGR